MVDFSKAGAENASFTPSKSPCSCVEVTILFALVAIFPCGATVNAETDVDDMIKAAVAVAAAVVRLMMNSSLCFRWLLL